MELQKTEFVPAWTFQTIAIVLCLTCLIGLMFQLGMFPPSPRDMSAFATRRMMPKIVNTHEIHPKTLQMAVLAITSS